MGNYSTDIQGSPLHHPPIPGDSYHPTSMRSHNMINTGSNPGPYPDGPRDPRLEYPRTISPPRKAGEGCSSCKWNATCKVLFFNRNFGLYENNYVSGSVPDLDPNVGRSCESWNIALPPLDPEVFNSDGLGLGDPITEGTVPPDAIDPGRYTGQYGDIRLAEPAQKDAVNS